MSRNHSATTGCEDCAGDRLKPKLGRLNIRHHISTLGGRLCAAELEVVSDDPYVGQFPVNTKEIAGKWGAKKGHDHYGAHGFETCMAPASLDLFDNQAQDFESAFRSDGVYVTQECGGHIHSDARDFCIDDICRLLQIYRYLEPALFKMTPAWRRSIGACPKINDYYMDFGLDLVKGLKSAIKFKEKLDAGGGMHRFGHGFRGNWHERHCGLNAASWFEHGTVELRLPPGLMKKIDISGWARLMAAVMNYARTAKFFKLRLRNILDTKLPSIKDSIAELNFIIAKQDQTILPWAQDQQSHATANWSLINKRRLAEI